jgi:hypothetical protein
MKKFINRRGSLAVETAIFLPLFLIAVLTLGYLIRICGISENVYHSACDESLLIAAKGDIPVRLLTYKKDLTARVMDENSKDLDGVEVDKFLYRVPYVDVTNGRAYTNLIGTTLDVDVKYRLPHLFRSTDKLSLTVISRAFVGHRNTGAEKTSFDEMEKDDDGELVWVFPRAGEKYHGENCSFIKNNPREVILDYKIRKKYSPCKLCKPNDAPNGRLVYCFPKSGGAYHLGECHTVKKYVISMTEEEAKSEGYRACKTCGGK